MAPVSGAAVVFTFAGGLYGGTFIFSTTTPDHGRPGSTLSRPAAIIRPGAGKTVSRRPPLQHPQAKCKAAHTGVVA